MKFGRFVSWYDDIALSNSSKVQANIGDNVQAYAITNLYHAIGIEENEIIDLNYTDLKDYQGEYVIVPMAQALSNYKRYQTFPLSERVIPFFISTAQCEEECEDILPVFSKFQPIGCRDEVTMKLLRRKGIQAYLTGCITLTLPKRQHEPQIPKVFLVDIPSKLEEYIPEEIMKYAVRVTHGCAYEKIPVDKEEIQRLDKIARELYRQYYNEATLVISSRLHAIAPCLAMGIPVIAVSNNFDYRFSWLDKFTPLYYPKDFESIDWHPQAVELEEFKESFKNIFKNGILKLKDKYGEWCDLSAFMEDRSGFRCNYVLEERVLQLKQRFHKNKAFSYLIWGCGVHGKLAYQMMQENCPDAECRGFVDSYVQEQCIGKEVYRPSDAILKDVDFIWITTHPGRIEAKEMLDGLGKMEMQDYDWFMSMEK